MTAKQFSAVSPPTNCWKKVARTTALVELQGKIASVSALKTEKRGKRGHVLRDLTKTPNRTDAVKDDL